MDSNADNNVFRFNVLRAAAPAEGDYGPVTGTIARTRPEVVSRAATTPRPATRSGPTRAEVEGALREFERLDVAPLVKFDKQHQPILGEAGARSLSAETIATAQSLNLPVAVTPVPEIMRGLVKAIGGFNWPGGNGGSQPSPATEPEPAALRAVGITELLVVKQQIKRYEPGEIAYIENVLAGESRARVTRSLDRIEEILSIVEERERERETEVQSTERFELNRETSRTQETDRKSGFGLSLSGRYGPSVEFSSTFETSGSSSEQLSQTVAVNYAKEVVERSKERIVERVRTERKVTIVREIEETIERSIKNETGDHRSGIYQFVDKIYESQVFNYGLRQIFDLMVPEPASYLWYLQNQPNPDIEVPIPPRPLDADVRSALDLTEGLALQMAARYNVQGVRPPPPLFTHRQVHFGSGTGGEDSEEGKPLAKVSADVEIPAGYRLFLVLWSASGTSDDDPTLSISFASLNDLWQPAAADRTDVGDDNKIYRMGVPRALLGAYSQVPFANDQKLACEAIVYESANFGIDLDVHLIRTLDEYNRWQYATYDLLADGYANAMLRYEQDLEAYRQRQAAMAARTIDFGDSPSRNELMIRAELKKHCLAFIRNQHLGSLSTDHTDPTSSTPPQFDISDALQDGKTIRFLELAFEWDQIQYVFYPYYWARAEQWADRFAARSFDPELEEFLQAGSARVVVPVRPGFEQAVSYFIETGNFEPADGEMDVHDPLYVSIVTEIQERTGAGQGEIAVGDPWETRLPTSLLYARHSQTLPQWQRDASGDWKWTPVPS